MSSPNPAPGTTYGEVLGWVIRELRKRENLDQSDLANCIHVKQPSWSRVETGASALSVQQLDAVARRLGTSSQEILRLVDQAIRELNQKGYKVVNDQKSDNSSDDVVAVIGLIGIGALIGAILFGSEK